MKQTKSIAFPLLVVTILSLGALLAYAWTVTETFEAQKTKWATSSQSIEQKSELLSQLYNKAGYGGLIHNFKNYILRGNPTYLKAARKNFKELKFLAKDLDDLSFDERDTRAIRNILDVVYEYADKFDAAEKAVQMKLPPAEVDQLVRVDDTRALVGLNILETSTKRHYKKAYNHFTNVMSNVSHIFSTYMPIMVVLIPAFFAGIIWIVWYFVHDKITDANTKKRTIFRNILREWPSHILVLVIGISLALAGAWVSYLSQENRLYENFEYLAQKDFDLMNNSIKNHEETLYDIGAFYLSSRNVERSEFQQITQRTLDRHISYDAIGWIDFDKAAEEYRFSHIQPNHHQYLEGTQITSDNVLFDMITHAIHNGEASYFLQPLSGADKSKNSIDLHDIHHGPDGDEQYHLVVFNPVYQQSETGKEQLLGLSFSVLDYTYLFQEAFPLADENLLRHEIKKREMGKPDSVIYSEFQSSDDIAYEYTLVKDLSNMQLAWNFKPDQKFLDQYKTYDIIIIFAVLCAFTMAVLFMRQMMTNMRVLTQARSKAEELNGLKSDFLATMSHEIRTPMNGILGMAELIQGANPSPQIERYAKTLITSGESLQKIIDDILDFSKIEAGKLTLETMPVNLLDLVDDIAILYAVKARDKALELAVRYVPGSEQFILSDPVRLRQILGNLISNAIKFTDKGHVTLTIEEIKTSEIKTETVTLKFSISDTGVGLSKNTIQQVFDKFQQADTSTTRKYGGTGLGLSICKRLVELIGGDIGVESEYGRGSTFWFSASFPRNTEEVTRPPSPESLRGLRVLVVDDLPIIRQVLHEQLSSAGMRCDTASSGKEAFEKIKESYATDDPYQISIIDYLMPNMNGEMLASIINDYPDLRSTCLILLTAAGNPLADHDFIKKGFSAYLAKPVHSVALIEGLSIIWEQYQNGATDSLIQIDTDGLGRKQEHHDNPALSDMRILIAEDNLVNQVFIKEILEETQSDYTIVSNGKEAVYAVQQGRYDLILMDCLMPEMDGFEASTAIQQLIADGAIAPVPICALTANAMAGDREKCLAAGMDDYLSKPVRSKELKAKIVSLIYGDGQSDHVSSVTLPPSRSQDAVMKSDDDDRHIDHAVVAADAPDPAVSDDKDTIDDSDTPILDHTAVENARSILKEKYDDMVIVFIENSQDRIQEINNAIDNDDVEGIIRPAHTLKSMSKQMGAMRLADVAKAIEYSAKAIHKGEAMAGQSIDEIASNMPQVRDLLLATKQAFDE